MARSESFDYVVVGAGSAGCVLANRLSEDPDVRVLLLEAGPVDHPWAWQLHMPAALAYPLKSQRYNWGYWSEPEPHMDGRRIYCPRGRVLGGSSSINGMAYVRGHARDYDRWAQSGLPGWDYAHVLPYFKRAETRARGARRLPGRRRTVARRDRRLSQSPLPGLHRGGAPGRLSALRRHERLPAGGLRADGHDGPGRAPLERGARVPGRGPAPAEPDRAHRRADPAGALRGRPRRRRRACRRRAHRERPRRARGDPRRRRDQLAAAADAVRHRRRRRARAVRHSGGGAPAGRRPQSPGPPGDLRAARVHPADLAVRGAAALEQGAHRPGVDPAEAGPRRDQPFRGGRLHPLARGRRASRSAVPFPADRGELRRQQSRRRPTAFRRTSGRCARPRSAGSACARPTRASRPRSCSTTWQPKATARRCAPRCA